ncbi:MAG TPA: helix-turn-helix transcriptional regulator [Stellaceae bacterium]|nr:helix-turn-helix transcriptional regulator [Stellaceae bacterium]
MRESLDESGNARYGRGTGVPDPVDVHVGVRIRTRRLLLGMNQETLANALGLTFQQVQKYEGGANRVSASRLVQVAEVLGVPVAYFFPDLDSTDDTAAADKTEIREMMQRPEAIELIRWYYAITDPGVRQQFLEMVKAVAQSHQRE